MSQPPHTAEAASEPQDLAVTISAWMDGDDAAPMPEAVLTKQGQQTWQVYHLIGDTLRTPELAIPPTSAVRARVAPLCAHAHHHPRTHRARTTIHPRHTRTRNILLQGCKVLVAIERAKLESGVPDPGSAYWN